MNNPADAVMHMITDDRYGLGRSMDKIGDTFSEHRDYCNELVESRNFAGLTLMNPRYTVDGAVEMDQDVVSRCNNILAHNNASLAYNNGTYEIYANKDLPTTGLTEITEDWLTSGLEWSDTSAGLFTELKLRYGSNEDNQYQLCLLYTSPSPRDS